jgi:hypothetical protein
VVIIYICFVYLVVEREGEDGEDGGGTLEGDGGVASLVGKYSRGGEERRNV